MSRWCGTLLLVTCEPYLNPIVGRFVSLAATCQSGYRARMLGKYSSLPEMYVSGTLLPWLYNLLLLYNVIIHKSLASNTVSDSWLAL